MRLGNWAMESDQEWEAAESRKYDLTVSAGMSVLRITLLFGSAAIALALLVTPIVSRISQPESNLWSGAQGIDYTQTGSIGYQGSYTIRRSVLQGSAGSICVIRDNGTRSGDC